MRQLLGFAWSQTRASAFAAALLGGLAVSRVLPALPVARYDLLLCYGVLLTLLFWRRGWESGRDIAVITACHGIGLAFELVKVQLGSWSYPEPAVLKFAGVPLYGGFLYAAVGSYVCRAWHLLDLELVRYRPRAMAAVAALIYVNFFSHHWLPDARWVLAGLLALATAGTCVRYTVQTTRRRMPLLLSFALIGFFLWVAENMATYFGAWRYPYQLHGWQPVGPDKLGAWSLLISVTFVLAAIGRTRPTDPAPKGPPTGWTSPSASVPHRRRGDVRDS